MAHNNCRYCGSNKITNLYSTTDIFEDNYQISLCRDCKCHFLNPYPSAEQLNRAYDDSYYGNSEEKFEGIFEKVMDYFRKQRARQVASQVNANANILDIGCGNGRFLMALHKLNHFNLYGTELPGKSAQRAARHPEINLNIGKLTQNTFPQKHFDAITLFHVFEHLENPSDILDIIQIILKDHGILTISFPNIDSWQSTFFKGRWLHLDPPRHLFFFTPKHFINLMQDRGFRCVRTQFFSIEQNPFGLIQSTLNLFHPKREILFESMKNNKNYLKNIKTSTLRYHKIFFYCGFGFAIIADAFASIFKKSATVTFTFTR